MASVDARATGDTARLAVGVVVAGVLAGGVGWALSRLLRGVERVAWGPVGARSLLAGVAAAPGARRVLVLAGAGLLGAGVWFALYRWARPVVPLAEAVAGRRMWVPTTLVHASLQVVLVGLGASIGREVAPRELSAALAGWVARRLRLPDADARTLVACAAGAGLAAVYSVPVAGALFALEILLGSFRLREALCAAAVSALAVVIAHGPGGGPAFYRVPTLGASPSLLAWSLLAGPLLGLAGSLFARAAHHFEAVRLHDARLFALMPLVFAGVGAVATRYPEVLGNGQSVAQAAFDATALTPILALAALKALTTLATIGAGTWGGTLNPSVAIGAGLGAGLGLAWSLVLPATTPAACAFVGAAAFLATTQRAPLTSIMLVVEFTHQGGAILLPTLLATAAALATSEWISHAAHRGTADL